MDPVGKLQTNPRAAPAPTPAAAAAKEFEAVFIASFLGEMLEQARPKTMGGGAGEQMFGSLMAQEVARQIAESGGLGLAASVEAQMDAYKR